MLVFVSGSTQHLRVEAGSQGRFPRACSGKPLQPHLEPLYVTLEGRAGIHGSVLQRNRFQLSLIRSFLELECIRTEFPRRKWKLCPRRVPSVWTPYYETVAEEVQGSLPGPPEHCLRVLPLYAPVTSRPTDKCPKRCSKKHMAGIH